MNSIVYQYWFLSNQEIPYTKKYKLYEYFLDAYHVYYSTEQELTDSGILNQAEIRRFLTARERADIEKDYREFTRSPFSFITVEDNGFPDRLREIADPAYGLFHTGKIPSFEKSVSIVGARRCSAYGKKMAGEISAELAKRGFTIISGMARGIDTAAHMGCLEEDGKTVAVLGSGIDVVYPPENNILYERIASTGAVLSEYPMGMNPLAENFPRRNRIVSALSSAIVVVEAREKSGSLITADLALDQGKDIYVVPGRIADTLSFGCNKLASMGAGLIYNVEKFADELLGEYGEKYIKREEKKIEIPLTSEEKMLLTHFDYYPKNLVNVASESGMDYLNCLTNSMALVRKGLLFEAFKNHFVLS
ncbi:MAG: DNA-processing protein DprA [Pseudobutyrivibrio sp.]|nr:DNA-processing protein DprA [Pseudobutyrivibrio sp.]